MTVLRKVRRAAVEAADDDAREVTVIVNTEDPGRDDIVLMTGGIDLTAYRENPVVLAQHEQAWPIARAVEIAPDAQNRLIARVKFPPAGVSARADEMLGLVRAGVVNAVSSGFGIIDAEPLDPKHPGAAVRITRSELQEFSFVSVPALPSALVTQREVGAGDDAIKEIRRMARTKRAAEDWRCGAARDLPIDDSGEWDGQAAEDSIFAWAGGDDFDPDKAKRGFLLYDAGNAKEKGGYKLPFARVSGGDLKAVTEGLRAAASRLPQTDAPQAELDIAKSVLESYEEKAGVGDEDRAAGARVRRTMVKRGLYEVGELAYVMQQLGWVKDCAAFEASVENDASAVPAMLGEALKKLGEALIAMTAEEVAEMLAGVEDDAEDVPPDERALSPRVRAFRRGLRAGAMKRREAAPFTLHSARAHRRMAALYERELTRSA